MKGGTSASGGLWSTAGDVARWGTHLLGLEELHRPYAHAGWDEAFGLGVECVRVDGRELWGHEGATVGFRSILLYDRDANAGAAVLTNATQFGDARALAASLVPQSSGRRADEPAPPEIEGILGSWWSEGIEHRFRWTGRLETDDAVFVAGSARPLPLGAGPRGGRAASRRPRRGRRADRALVGRLSVPAQPGYSY